RASVVRNLALVGGGGHGRGCFGAGGGRDQSWSGGWSSDVCYPNRTVGNHKADVAGGALGIGRIAGIAVGDVGLERAALIGFGRRAEERRGARACRIGPARCAVERKLPLGVGDGLAR